MVKLLLDANLSYRLTKKLASSYPDCIHVTGCGLPIPAKDAEIWQWAKIKGFIIVANYEDFQNLLSLHSFPPKIVLLRTGNQSTNYIATLLIDKKEEIEMLQNSNEIGMIEFF